MSQNPPSPSSESTSALAAIDALLAPFNRSDAPGLVVGIAHHGKHVYRRAVGMASLEQGVANTPSTRMRIASTSKQFTAFAVLLLAEDGLVALDDLAQKHLPELPQLSANGPTLRHLLNHTSGWRGHDEVWALAHGLTFHAPGPGLPAMARQSELNFEPGTQMIYSNGGYHLLAKIVERVSGLDFNSFLKTRIFEPLGMHSTESVATDLDVRPGLAGLYMPALGGGWQRGLYPCELDGGGSLISTLDDMLRWQAQLRSSHKTVGRAESWALLMAPTSLSSGSTVPYGFGLARHPYRGVEIIHHAGAVLGASSQMLSVPEHALDIIIMANGAAVSPAALACKLVDLLLAEQLPEPHESRPQASAYAALPGQRYHAASSGCVISFADIEGKLAMSWQSSSALVMHQDQGRLWLGLQDLPTNDLELDASEVAGTQPPESFTLREGGQPQHFRRLAETPPDAATLAPLLSGNYQSPDLDASVSVALTCGQLLLTVLGRYGHQVGVLQPWSEDVFVLTSTDALLAKLGSSVVNVERHAGKVTGLRLATLRTRAIHLIRQETQV
jgi:CubicO group peptidase (beta-lactamase class C family)